MDGCGIGQAAALAFKMLKVRKNESGGSHFKDVAGFY
jgi:hypothetical protein